MNYDELRISEENKKEEMKSLEKIKQCVNTGKSWIFDSGAGAGKTYTLIETLKYIMIKKEKQLKFNNQKIICITYTNVAADEIKQRLGKTQLVNVSTIHEYIWETISPYKKLLVDQHKEYLEKQVEEYKNRNPQNQYAHPGYIMSSGLFQRTLEGFQSKFGGFHNKRIITLDNFASMNYGNYGNNQNKK